MGAKEIALAEIVDIAQRNNLVAKDITAALKAVAKDYPSGGILSRLLAYIGGIFLLCGLGFLIEMHWENMNTTSHLVITLGAGLAALILAILFLDHDQYLGLTALMIYLSTVAKSRTMLFVSTCSMCIAPYPNHRVPYQETVTVVN